MKTYKQGMLFIVLEFLFMGLVSAFEISEDYPYIEPYTHEQGENRNIHYKIYKEVAHGIGAIGGAIAIGDAVNKYWDDAKKIVKNTYEEGKEVVIEFYGTLEQYFSNRFMEFIAP